MENDNGNPSARGEFSTGGICDGGFLVKAGRMTTRRSGINEAAGFSGCVVGISAAIKVLNPRPKIKIKLIQKPNDYELAMQQGFQCLRP